MLTDSQCRNATCPPDRKQARFADSGGMYLQVSPNGSKRWFWKYRIDGKEKQFAIGSYPAVSLAAARKARDAAKVQKASGFDPIHAKQAAKLASSVSIGDTFSEIAAEWLKQQQPAWSEHHYTREHRNITKDLNPYIGKRPINQITPIELLALIRKVEDRGAINVAHRVHCTAHSVWCYAVAIGRADRDITPDIKKALKPHTKKNYPAIIEPLQLGQLLRAMDAYQGGLIVRAALQIAPILFQRPGNLRTMRWCDLDLEAAIWSIPSEDMKRTVSQKVNGRAHTVPLPRQVVAILRGLHPVTGHGEFVFHQPRKPRNALSEAGITPALHAIGYKGIQTWHGFRATGRTIIRQVFKIDPDVIEAQLAHKGQITHGGAYDRATFQNDVSILGSRVCLNVWCF